VWPTRPETIQTTIIILIAVTIVAAFIYLLDMILASSVNLVTIG